MPREPLPPTPPSGVPSLPPLSQGPQGRDQTSHHHPPPSAPSCISFAPSKAVELPPNSLMVLRFPAAYGIPAAFRGRGSPETPLIQVAPRSPYTAWLEAASVLFPS